MSDWKTALANEWKNRQAHARGGPAFPLTEQSFEADEILAMTEVLLSGQLTMASKVREFETGFSRFVGAPYAVMVNSGSSANLLAVAAACNPARERHLRAGDEVLVPAVCWSTSVWPLIQFGLKPIFVDVDPQTLNIDLHSLRKLASPSVRGLLAVHILGNSGPMKQILTIARERNWILIEDTCESLGSTADGRSLGCLGDMGTYSFYFSHHMTTGEGGMVTCQTLEDYDLLKCLRAHGWTRELSNRAEVEARHPDIDARFMFVNAGFNFRPMEVQGALGLQQLKKLKAMNAVRVHNRNELIGSLRSHPLWKNQFEFPIEPAGTQAAWFGFPVLLSKSFDVELGDYLARLQSEGIENRPVVSGNFARQPGLKIFNIEANAADYPGAEEIHRRGFFIGLHARTLTPRQLEKLSDVLLRELKLT